ncbi:MAG: tetratricopeptide repeat protein [Anaerolineae bacterium]
MPSSVTARLQQMTIPTYPALPPDINPMFYETRGVQGSKGNIYPHPVQDQISSEKVDRTYQAIVLENEYIELVLLPELGGRIYTGLDKTNGYDFFYRHQVIKPALIGTFGPWISGGIEFNWPQHHRPSTTDPTDFTIEEYPDGSITVWMGEHEPLNRTKGMVGVTLHPGKAVVETKVRLFNRSAYPQSFLWWANAGVPINEQYQVVFPPDVHYAVYHGKAPVTAFPIATGTFAGGNDYGDGTDISYWANSPGATSFFSAPSKYEFFGGYDHLRKSGIVHVADAGISSGKKYFTWANGPYGHGWQKNLYDLDVEGEYLELMAGVYTDNQPDFSWIMPSETRSFSQFWLPVQRIGAMKNANTRAAVNLEISQGQAFVGAYATELLPQARIVLCTPEQVLLVEHADLGPGHPFTCEVILPDGTVTTDLLLCVITSQGEEVIRYQPEAPWQGRLPEPYKPAPRPADIATLDELFLAGLHHEQYHSSQIAPEWYWLEALKRDPGDSRCNLGMGKLALRSGDFGKAEAYLRKSIARLTWLNYNPYDGEAYYYLGLCLQYQDRMDEAYKAYYKATWNYAWQSAAYYGLAQIDVAREHLDKALDHLDRSLQVNTRNAKARGLKAGVLRRMGQGDQAGRLVSESLALDPLDFWARYELAQSDPALKPARITELRKLLRDDPLTVLDLAMDFMVSGLDAEATELLEMAAIFANLHSMIAYSLSYLARRSGNQALANDWHQRAMAASPDYCFPWRLEEMLILQDVLRANPHDARAGYYLGNLLYDKKRYQEAVALWRTASELEPGLAILWRNLGLAAYILDEDLDQALAYYEKAVAANPADPRLLLEQDFLLRRKSLPPEERLARFLCQMQVVSKRDDLVLELMALYNRTGHPEQALELAGSRNFHPWEGGEGAVAGQYVNAYWLLGRQALEGGDPAAALELMRQGLAYPPNLGEQARVSDSIQLRYYIGLCLEQLGRADEARTDWEQVLTDKGWRGELSLIDYYHALALLKLGHEVEGRTALLELKQRAIEKLAFGVTHEHASRNTSNPAFYEDPNKASRIHHQVLLGLACLALGDLYGARSALGVALALDPANLAAWEEWKSIK